MRSVGRVREQAAIDEAISALACGPVCLEIVGEPGIGKTTMLGALRAAASGALVLGARGSEFEHDRPFGIVADALDGHLADVAARGLRGVDQDTHAELAAIFPALQSPVASGAPVRAGEGFRTHRAIRNLLELLAATRPLVLALDDVHWADSSSIDLIGALLRHRPSARVLLALAYRPHQAPERLTRELAVAGREGLLRRIDLGPLTEDDVRQLLDEGISEADREWLFSESGGNPFYLRQLARTASRVRARSGLGAGVPLTVAASLFSELEGVSSGARGLARAISIAGDPFDLDLVAGVAVLDRDAVLAGLDELIGADLLRVDDKPMSFTFRHPLVRRAVYESMQPGWRIAAHGRADALLAARGASPTQRAHHVEQSAGVGDERAIAVLVCAASTAIVPAAAARWLRAAVRLTSADGEQRLGLLCRLGEALAAAGLLDDSRRALSEALARWPSGGDEDARIAVVVLCATVDRLLGRHEQARMRLSAAAGELDDPASRAGVSVAIELAAEHLFSRDFTGIRVPARAALRHATALRDPVLRAVAVAITAFAEYAACDLPAARSMADQADRLIRALDDDVVAARPDAFFLLGWTHRMLDDYAAAEALFQRGLAVALTSGHTQLSIELACGRANALAQLGRIGQARAAKQEAVEAARLAESPQQLAWALLMSCVVETPGGDLDTAIRDGREAIALAVDGSSVSATCGVALGAALAEAGDWAEAIEVSLAWAGGVELPGVFPMLRPWSYEVLTLAELGLGRVEQAAGWAARAAAIVEAVECDLPRALAQRAGARVALARGDGALAASIALASAARADAVQARVEAARSRLVAGQALAAGGLRAQSGEQLRLAEAQAAACGARRVREECVRELRRIGRRVARAGVRGDQAAGGLAALSGREREVAELVRARHTNREIAERLFLSEKTIESHLRSIFVKLGVSSRTDVARAAELHAGP